MSPRIICLLSTIAGSSSFFIEISSDALMVEKSPKLLLPDAPRHLQLTENINETVRRFFRTLAIDNDELLYLNGFVHRHNVQKITYFSFSVSSVAACSNNPTKCTRIFTFYLFSMGGTITNEILIITMCFRSSVCCSMQHEH